MILSSRLIPSRLFPPRIRLPGRKRKRQQIQRIHLVTHLDISPSHRLDHLAIHIPHEITLLLIVQVLQHVMILRPPRPHVIIRQERRQRQFTILQHPVRGHIPSPVIIPASHDIQGISLQPHPRHFNIYNTTHLRCIIFRTRVRDHLDLFHRYGGNPFQSLSRLLFHQPRRASVYINTAFSPVQFNAIHPVNGHQWNLT